MTRKQSSHSVVYNLTGHPVYTTDQRVHVERSTVQPFIIMHGFTPEHCANNLTNTAVTQHFATEKWQAEADAEKLGDDQGSGILVQLLFPILYALSLCSLTRDSGSPRPLTSAFGITRALTGCDHAGLPVRGRLARLLVRDNAVSVRILYCW